MSSRSWYSITNQAGETPELFIYDEIGYWGVSAVDMIHALRNIDAPRIKVRIHSPGGSVSEGVAIFNALRKHPAAIDVEVDSIAASIASVIAMAGDTITIASNALMMIHNPWGFGEGSADDLRHLADVMDKFKDTIITTYAERTGLEASNIEQLMQAESWFTAEEALAIGLVDAIDNNIKTNTGDGFSNRMMNSFQHMPDHAKHRFQRNATPSESPCFRDHGKGDSMNKTELIAQLKEAGTDVHALEQKVEGLTQSHATAQASLDTLNTLVGARSHDEVAAALSAADAKREALVESIIASRRTLGQIGDADQDKADAQALYVGMSTAMLAGLAEPLSAAATAHAQLGQASAQPTAEQGEVNKYRANTAPSKEG